MHLLTGGAESAPLQQAVEAEACRCGAEQHGDQPRQHEGGFEQRLRAGGDGCAAAAAAVRLLRRPQHLIATAQKKPSAKSITSAAGRQQ